MIHLAPCPNPQMVGLKPDYNHSPLLTGDKVQYTVFHYSMPHQPRVLTPMLERAFTVHVCINCGLLYAKEHTEEDA